MDEAELRLLITAQIEQAHESMDEVGHDVDKMARQIQLSATISGEAFDKLIAKSEELKAELHDIRDTIVKVHVDDREAMAKIAEVRAAEGSIGGGANVNVGAQGGGMGALAAVGLSVLPTLSPLLAATTNAVMGLASAFTSASAGVGGFAAVAISYLKGVFTATSALNKAQAAYATATTSKQRTAALQAEKKALYGLDGAQIQAVHALQHFEEYWQDFARSFQKPVFRVFELALKGIETLMGDMKPVISAAASAFVTLGTQMDKALGSSDNKQFFNWLAKTAGTAILAFGHMTGNVMRGVANLMMAFGGSAKSMESGLVHMTAEFYKWTDALGKTKGFKEFLAYAASSGKAVLGMLGQLVKLVGHLLVAFAPLGLEMVKFIKDLAQFINRLLTTNPLIQTMIKGVLGAAKAILQFADGLLRNHPRLVTAAADIALLWGSYKLMSSGVLKAIDIGKKFGGMLINITGKVVRATVAVGRFVGQMAKMSLSVLKFIGQGIRMTAVIVGQTIKIVAQTAAWVAWRAILIAWRTVQMIATAAMWAFNVALDANPIGLVIGLIAALALAAYELIRHWRTVTSFFKHLWSDIGHIFSGIWHTVEHWIGSLASSAYHWGANFINMFKNGIMAGVRKVESVVRSVAHTVKKFLGFGSPTEAGPGATSDRWAPNFIHMYTDGLQAGVPKVQEALRKVLEPGANMNVNANVNGGAEALGAQTASALADTAATQAHGETHVHNHITIHAGDISDPRHIETLAQRIAWYQTQQLHTIGANG